VAERMQRIDRGGVVEVIEELTAHKDRGKVRILRLYGYLNRFQDAVHYDAFREQGIPLAPARLKVPTAPCLKSA